VPNPHHPRKAAENHEPDNMFHPATPTTTGTLRKGRTGAGPAEAGPRRAWNQRKENQNPSQPPKGPDLDGHHPANGAADEPANLTTR
jgi:hypothetical protein